MQPEEEIKHIHIIGICGSGTSGLACLLKEKGFVITGSDERAYPPANEILEEAGIKFNHSYSSQNVGMPDLVIEGAAIGVENPEAAMARAQKLRIMSFPEALNFFFLRERYSIVVSGTHGKTTISSLIAWFLEQGGLAPSFLIGGVPINFGRNYKLGGGNYFVVEGDEYDSARFDPSPKFLHYNPKIAVITSIEFDHVDKYKSVKEIEEAFVKFVDLLPKNGTLIANYDYENVRSLIREAKCRVITYGLSKEASLRIMEFEQSKFFSSFKILRGGSITTLVSPLSGIHNAQNVAAAYLVALSLGVPEGTIKKALASFMNVRRRLEIKGCVNDIRIIDDFAHHPTEVWETLFYLHDRFPGSRVICVFEPRTHSSRRKHFLVEYADSFSSADEVIIAPVYKWGELREDERLDPEELVGMIKSTKAHFFPSIEAIVEYLVKNLRAGDVVIFMSSGNFSFIHQKLLNSLKEKN
jgi:UDP-N-acetylmuramate: L-alanyl-gamma-D-glutamyl-meso-diaminopimelate ligase